MKRSSNSKFGALGVATLNLQILGGSTAAACNFELVSKNCINNYTTRYCNANNELFYHAVIVFKDIVTFHKQYDDYDPN